MQVLEEKRNAVSRTTRNRLSHTKANKALHQNRRREIKHDGIANGIVRIPDSLNLNQLYAAVRSIDFKEKSFVESKEIKQKYLIKQLIALNNALSSKPGYFDRQWFGDETITEIIRHIEKVVNKIYGKNLSISYDYSGNIKFSIYYDMPYEAMGTHIALADIVKFQKKKKRLFKLLFDSLTFIGQKYHIIDMYESYFFQITMESIEHNVNDMADDELEDYFGEKREDVLALVESYNKDGEIHKWFKKLNENISETDLLKQLERDKEKKHLKKFVALTMKLINEKSGLKLPDFIDRIIDDNNEETPFIEGMSIYWDDDAVTTEAFDSLNSLMNESGVLTPTLSRNPLTDTSTKNLAVTLVRDLQNWIVALNNIMYERT